MDQCGIWSMDEVLLGTTLKPWLKPVLVGSYVRGIESIPGFLGWCEMDGFRNHPR